MFSFSPNLCHLLVRVSLALLGSPLFSPCTLFSALLSVQCIVCSTCATCRRTATQTHDDLHPSDPGRYAMVRTRDSRFCTRSTSSAASASSSPRAYSDHSGRHFSSGSRSCSCSNGAAVARCRSRGVSLARGLGVPSNCLRTAVVRDKRTNARLRRSIVALRWSRRKDSQSGSSAPSADVERIPSSDEAGEVERLDLGCWRQGTVVTALPSGVVKNPSSRKIDGAS
jgi:hypothetical protein